MSVFSERIKTLLTFALEYIISRKMDLKFIGGNPRFKERKQTSFMKFTEKNRKEMEYLKKIFFEERPCGAGL